jgi:copper chaperone CopZ
MTCESCIKDISGSLFKLSGIQKVEANLKDQLVTIEGTGSSHFAYHSFCIEPFPDMQY